MKNFGNSSRGRRQGLSKIFMASRASRGHLCDSSASLFYLVFLSRHELLLYCLHFVKFSLNEHGMVWYDITDLRGLLYCYEVLLERVTGTTDIRHPTPR